MGLSATLAEVEQVFIQNELKQAKTICITADKPGSGTTAMAMALTERYLLAGYRTLLVDFNLSNPTFDVIDLDAENTSERLIEHKKSQQTFLGVAAPLQRQQQLAYRDPKGLQGAIDSWLNEYDRVVFDTSALSLCNQSNIPTVVIANASDTTLLVISAGSTQSEQLNTAIEQLNQANAQIGGIILNQFQQPSWAESIESSLGRVPVIGSRLGKYCKNQLHKFPIFRYGV